MIDKYTQIEIYAEIVGYKDKLEMLRAVLSYPIINWVTQFFSRTRCADVQLGFIECCREIIESRRDELSDEEYEDFDGKLVSYELHAYDRLNLFADYVHVFRETQSEKPYAVKFLSERRYDIIHRKWEKYESGMNIEHLKKHHQDRLTDEELASRFEEMKRLFEFIKQRHSSKTVVKA
jgi:hypothetical protein